MQLFNGQDTRTSYTIHTYTESEKERTRESKRERHAPACASLYLAMPSSCVCCTIKCKKNVVFAWNNNRTAFAHRCILSYEQQRRKNKYINGKCTFAMNNCRVSVCMYLRTLCSIAIENDADDDDDHMRAMCLRRLCIIYLWVWIGSCRRSVLHFAHSFSPFFSSCCRCVRVHFFLFAIFLLSFISCVPKERKRDECFHRLFYFSGVRLLFRLLDG